MIPDDDDYALQRFRDAKPLDDEGLRQSGGEEKSVRELLGATGGFGSFAVDDPVSNDPVRDEGSNQQEGLRVRVRCVVIDKNGNPVAATKNLLSLP